MRGRPIRLKRPAAARETTSEMPDNKPAAPTSPWTDQPASTPEPAIEQLAATPSPATELLAATPAPMDEGDTPADDGVPSPAGSFVNEVDSEMCPNDSQIAASHESFMAFVDTHRQCRPQLELQPFGSGVSELTHTKVEPVEEGLAEDNALLAEATQMDTEMQAELQAVESRTQADDQSLMSGIRNFGSAPSDAESSSLEEIFRGSQASSSQSRPTTQRLSTPASGIASAFADTDPLCVKCGFPCEPMKAVMKTKASVTQHAKWICKPCNNICTMLNRHIVQEGELKISSWTNEQTSAFFKMALEEGFNDGRADWQLIRGCLKKVMTRRLTETSKKEVISDFKPLKAWAVLGYDIEMISAYNKTDWNPACGLCYAVPLKSMTWSQKEEHVEEIVMESEKSFQKRNKKTVADEEESADEAPKSKASTKRKSEADPKVQEKAARKEAADIRLHNNKMQIVASKGLSLLTPGSAKLKSYSKSKNWNSLPDFLKEKFSADLRQAEEWVAMSDQVIKLVKKCAKDGSRLPEAGFDSADITQLAKSMKKDLSDYEAFEKMVK